MIGLAVASFLAVLLQALQSRVVQAGDRVLMTVNGLLLGVMQATIWATFAKPGNDWRQVAVYASCGVLGAHVAVTIHPRLQGLIARLQALYRKGE